MQVCEGDENRNYNQPNYFVATKDSFDQRNVKLQNFIAPIIDVQFNGATGAGIPAQETNFNSIP